MAQVSPHFCLIESIVCAQTTASEPILSGLTGPIGRAEIEDRRPRRKRSATPQVAAAQPIVLPAKNEGMLEGESGRGIHLQYPADLDRLCRIRRNQPSSDARGAILC